MSFVYFSKKYFCLYVPDYVFFIAATNKFLCNLSRLYKYFSVVPESLYCPFCVIGMENFENDPNFLSDILGEADSGTLFNGAGLDDLDVVKKNQEHPRGRRISIGKKMK